MKKLETDVPVRLGPGSGFTGTIARCNRHNINKVELNQTPTFGSHSKLRDGRMSNTSGQVKGVGTQGVSCLWWKRKMGDRWVRPAPVGIQILIDLLSIFFMVCGWRPEEYGPTPPPHRPQREDNVG